MIEVVIMKVVNRNLKEPLESEAMSVKYWLKAAETILTKVRETVRKERLAERALREAVRGYAVEDISTQFDEIVGELVTDYFSKMKIPIRLYSEELGLRVIGKNPSVSGFLDEVDGTAMAFHDVHTYATTIAIIDNVRDFSTDRVISAATLRYSDGSIYSAGRGIGSFVNGHKTKTSTRKTLDDPRSLFFVDLQEEVPGSFVRCLSLLALKGFKRDIGSAALELAFISSGQADAFISIRQKLNDLGAGFILVKEAGGIVTDFEGRELKVPIALKGTTTLIAASNSKIHAEILSMIKM